jgi:hypothetical protein
VHCLSRNRDLPVTIHVFFFVNHAVKSSGIKQMVERNGLSRVPVVECLGFVEFFSDGGKYTQNNSMTSGFSAPISRASGETGQIPNKRYFTTLAFVEVPIPFDLISRNILSR